MRTLLTLMFWHVADAAFVRSCSGALFAVQRVSPEQPFKVVDRTVFQTHFSPRGAGIHLSRDKVSLRCKWHRWLLKPKTSFRLVAEIGETNEPLLLFWLCKCSC